MKLEKIEFTTKDGKILTFSADEAKDLYWGLHELFGAKLTAYPTVYPGFQPHPAICPPAVAMPTYTIQYP